MTEKQELTLKYLSTASSIQEAMLKAGYAFNTAINPRHSFLLKKDVYAVIQNYRLDLIRVGIDSETLYSTKRGRYEK